MKLGKIPKKLVYYCRPETKIRFRWSDVEFEDASAADVSAVPMFVADADNPKTNKTAKTWAEQYRWTWGPDGKRVENTKPFETVERENTPIANVRIIGLDIRGQGGRAYQALVDEKYLVDMREDVMLDTMLNVGMGVNATLPGEYIFAQIGAEMKLIRVGSKLHEMMIESTNFSEKKIIDTLVPGRIYSSKTKTVLYLGEVWYTQIVQNYNTIYRRNDPAVVASSRKRHLYVHVDTISPDLKTALGKDTTYYTSNIEFGESRSKSYREEHCTIENFDLEATLAEVRRKIEVCFDESVSKGYGGVSGVSLGYYSSMNISTVSGYVHPKLQERLF